MYWHDILIGSIVGWHKIIFQLPIKSWVGLTKSCTFKVSRDCETFLWSLARLARLARLPKPENFNVNIVKNDPLPFLLHLYMTIFWKKLIFWGKFFFYKLKNFGKKILIVTSLGVKVENDPQTIFIAFLCDNFLQNLVFPNHFPCQNIPKIQIIFCETFG